MKYKCFIVSFFSLLLACTSEPCPIETDVGAFNLLQEAKVKRFYSGFETLYFTDLSGDSIFLNSAEGLIER